MSKERDFPGICCMRADCPDHDCPGVQIAQLYQAQGGETIIAGQGSGITARSVVQAPPTRFASPILAARIALVLAALGYWAAVVIFDFRLFS